tara:strand:+ start:73 stop:237 length:165 start_codon:yes stop_codon:yes gene_type:complete
MDATIAKEILSTIVILANLFHETATQFDIDLQIVAFIIEDEFLSTTKRIVFVNN